MDTLAILLSKAIAKRKPLLKLTNAMRLVNGAGDDLKGLIIDRYGRHFAIQILDKRYHEKKDHVVHYLQKHCAAVYCIVKDRILSTASTPDAFVSQVYTDSASSTTIVEEYGLKFAVDLNDGLNSGLFLDMRKNRHMIAGLSKGKRVLNCFAYTCSFGVHCRAAGATSVINVDISKRYLERGQANYVLNHLPPGEKEFFRADAGFYLDWTAGKAKRFDLIIIDPPSFARHEKKVFSVKKDLEGLIALGLKALELRGQIFVATNFSGFTSASLEMTIRTADKAHFIKRIAHMGQDRDFPGSNQSPETVLSAALISI